ncbi:carbon storage regulator CsrA [Bacillus sp. SLBN-46]|uniref:carbon storage regulator n=1 Tax=Bacillus sp. SLBN-46 TaxID=3042283 RepID=UPI0028663CEF|nr:carbon storage regulator [Bacillus sp. SLBN-46]MDR6123772.1 carbon storage regulator CsrA [Bacillus sp. SLBN-46]
MLIVGREIGQSVIIDDVIKVTVLQIDSKLRMVIEAPMNMEVSKVKENKSNRVFLKKGTKIIESPTLIGANIKVTILQTESGLLRFAIDAPREIRIFREELFNGNIFTRNQKVKMI